MLMRKAAASGGAELAELDKRSPAPAPTHAVWKNGFRSSFRTSVTGGPKPTGSSAARARLETPRNRRRRRGGANGLVYHQWRAHQLADHHPDAAEPPRHRTKAAEWKERIDVVRS